MNVWAFPSFYPYDYPGLKWAGIFAHRQFKGLIANGAELAVIQPVYWRPASPFTRFNKDWEKSAKLNYPAKRVYDGITVYHPGIANLKPASIFRKTYKQRYIDSIVNFFKKGDIQLDPAKDIFYSQWLPDAFMVQEAAEILGVKSAVLVIGDDVLVWPHDNNERLQWFKDVLQNADQRFTVATYLGVEANKLLDKKLPFETIRRGVNYDFFKEVPAAEKELLKKEWNIPSGKIIILTIGSAIVRKGWLDLFDALMHIKKTNDQFILAAAHAGPVELNLDDEAAKRGLTAHFINLGEVDPTQVNRLYNIADIFCLPSHWEGIANCVVEAMSSGLPVITTNVCGHPELIRNNETGIMVPPKQPGILSAALAALMSSEEKRNYLGANAKNFIVQEWGNFSDNAEKLYQKLEQTLRE